MKEIKVSSKVHTNDLAASITLAVSEGEDVVLRAIGPPPISQAFKAVAVANRNLAPKGIKLAIIPELVKEEIEDRDNEGKTVPWVIALFNLQDLKRFVYILCGECGQTVQFDMRQSLPRRQVCEGCGTVLIMEKKSE